MNKRDLLTNKKTKEKKMWYDIKIKYQFLSKEAYYLFKQKIFIQIYLKIKNNYYYNIKLLTYNINKVSYIIYNTYWNDIMKFFIINNLYNYINYLSYKKKIYYKKYKKYLK
jgi:hypothetical protein